MPLLEFSCCCSFAKVETNLKIKVVFITLTMITTFLQVLLLLDAAFFLDMHCQGLEIFFGFILRRLLLF